MKEVRAAVQIVCAGEKAFLRCMYDREGKPAKKGNVDNFVSEEDKYSFVVVFGNYPGTTNIMTHADLREEFKSNKILWRKILSAKDRARRLSKNKRQKLSVEHKKASSKDYKEKVLFHINLSGARGIYKVVLRSHKLPGAYRDEFLLRKCKQSVKDIVITETELRKLIKKGDELLRSISNIKKHR